MAPPWPDPDELRRCEAEARDLAQSLIDYASVPARDHAYATLTAAADTLAVYEWAALLTPAGARRCRPPSTSTPSPASRGPAGTPCGSRRPP